MADTFKQDWKLFRERIGDWQEAYMEKLIQDYMKLLRSKKPASEKFWTLEKRIAKDKKKPGVILQLEQDTMLMDLSLLIRTGVITLEDLEGFSDWTKERVQDWLRD